MILILEIAMLIAGIYALITAKMPGWVVGKGFKAEGTPVRLLGILMAALLPGLFCAGIVIGIIATAAEFDPTLLVIGVEIGSVILVVIIVSVILRRIRQPDAIAPPSISNQKLE